MSWICKGCKQTFQGNDNTRLCHICRDKKINSGNHSLKTKDKIETKKVELNSFGFDPGIKEEDRLKIRGWSKLYTKDKILMKKDGKIVARQQYGRIN